MRPVLKRDAGVSERIPPNYEFAGRWQLNVKGSALVAMVAGSILILGLTFVLGTVIRALLRGPLEGHFSSGGLLFLPIILGVIVAVVILHEAVHGILFQVSGGKPRFGFKLSGRRFPVAYATSKEPILRNPYLLVSLGPFLMLTPVFLVIAIVANSDGIVALALVAMALNASGSTGDLIAARKIRRHDRSTLFQDTEDGFSWYVPSRPDR